MDNSVHLYLEELPDSESLEEKKRVIQDKLTNEGSRIAKLHWTLTRETALSGLRDCLRKLDAFEWLAKGWCTANELRDLAKQTAGDPNAEKELPLAKHPLTVVVHPVVTIHCDPIALPPLRFTLELVAQIESAVLLIRGGKLAAIEAATLTPSATLSYEDAELKKLEYKQIVLGRPYMFANGGLAIAA
ncbi:MAG TPA: hypothetical protein VKC17_10520 [Sphingomicrobium sp.]|nr:hypothetical protein [Sphingomicrobium sp.]